MSEEKTTGVQELIDRLSEEGVAEGQKQAAQIVSDAQNKASDILEQARREAKTILGQAREETEKLKTAGEEALRLAARDAVRDFGARLHNGFRRRLLNLVHHELKQPDLIKRMILEVTGKAAESIGKEKLEILLPTTILTDEEARQVAASDEKDEISKFVQGLVGENLREGVSVRLGREEQNGLTVRVTDQDVEIDLTDETISELLAMHMLPRFRAIVSTD